VPAPEAGHPAAGLTAGDVVARSLPDVPPEILGTIRGSVTVSVRVRVDRLGSVVDAALDSRAGSRYFDRVALEAARRWKFKPASDGAGQDVESTRLVRFEFRRDGCAASPDGPPR
jgi:TonB family protein